MVAGAILLPACTREGAILPPVDRGLAPGTWGGDNAGVLVSDSVAHVHVGCTNGDFPRPPQLDAQGRFSVTGSYQLRAYPVQRDPPVPAVLNGTVSGGMLTFTVAVNDTILKQQIMLGPKTVTFARDATMQACPICSKPER
jgi:hypothetical protein